MIHMSYFLGIVNQKEKVHHLTHDESIEWIAISSNESAMLHISTSLRSEVSRCLRCALRWGGLR